MAMGGMCLCELCFPPGLKGARPSEPVGLAWTALQARAWVSPKPWIPDLTMAGDKEGCMWEAWKDRL